MNLLAVLLASFAAAVSAGTVTTKTCPRSGAKAPNGARLVSAFVSTTSSVSSRRRVPRKRKVFGVDDPSPAFFPAASGGGGVERMREVLRSAAGGIENDDETGVGQEWHRVLSSCLLSLCVPLVFFLSFLLILPEAADAASAAGGSDTAPSARKVPRHAMRYWSIQDGGSIEQKIASNTALLDFAVGSINTNYYDKSGGAYFEPRDFYKSFRNYINANGGAPAGPAARATTAGPTATTATTPMFLGSRDGAVEALKTLVQQLHDPYSKYLTREELVEEFHKQNGGFLGVGAMVELPEQELGYGYGTETTTGTGNVIFPTSNSRVTTSAASSYLSIAQASRLPVVTAIVPDSPAERAGITVGDRIVAVHGSGERQQQQQQQQQYFEDFLRFHKSGALKDRLALYTQAENYLGHPDITVAKPVSVVVFNNINSNSEDSGVSPFNSRDGDRDVVVAYRPTRVRLPTATTSEPYNPSSGYSRAEVSGGDSIVHFELLDNSDSIFEMQQDTPISRKGGGSNKVGYIRLTRFSRSATSGYVRAVEALEQAGASSYIIDVRNNYGGIFQEAMLTASSLMRDPHEVLCYTINARGGFTPHDVKESIVENDGRYPGLLLSREPKNVARLQLQREKYTPSGSDGVDGIMWVPASSFTSLHEQTLQRGIHRARMSSAAYWGIETPPSASARSISSNINAVMQRKRLEMQKDLVILVNEGTASSAEVFASALRDNGRATLVGTKTYGKGLIQHTFPMPDGGGLRLTVAEYLTPKLHHVTHVGGAQFDASTGKWIGGGINVSALGCFFFAFLVPLQLPLMFALLLCSRPFNFPARRPMREQRYPRKRRGRFVRRHGFGCAERSSNIERVERVLEVTVSTGSVYKVDMGNGFHIFEATRVRYHS